jgi:hypothetical protein
MRKEKTELPFRLALRHEGSMWNAYLADRNTMNKATLVGSIAMAAVVNNPLRKQAFQQMMTEVLSDMVEEFFGVKPEMRTQEAPEHEKAGHS